MVVGVVSRATVVGSDPVSFLPMGEEVNLDITLLHTTEVKSKQSHTDIDFLLLFCLNELGLHTSNVDTLQQHYISTS